MKLSKAFYNREAQEVAKDLLGCFLVTEYPEGKTVGKIVETEAYLSANDLSSHSYKGKTQRNAVMFGPAGHAYIYFTYGMHYCINAVTREEGIGEGVLIRALEPVEGIELMEKRRGTDEIKKLCNGPAKLTQAMGINIKLNGSDLTKEPISILPANKIPEIVTARRIGIKKSMNLLLRFYIKDNPYISKH